MTESKVKVVFMPSGRRGNFPGGTPLLSAAQTLGVDIDSVCGGRGICGRCQILCMEGSFSKHGLVSKVEHLSPISDAEKKYSERKKKLAKGRRLSCHTLLQGDVVIDVPAESQVHRQVVRKDVEHRDITLDPCVHLYYVPVREADMYDPKGDLQRLYEALERDWGLKDLDIDFELMGQLQAVIREGKWTVTVALRHGVGNKSKRIIAIWPGFRGEVYGVSIDVGSTTVAANLCNLVSGEVVASGSLMNPQIRFGEDLMSRVSYVMMHPEGAEEMTSVIREALDQLIVQTAKDANVPLDQILELTLVANPVMHHILLGINPVELGGAPFALATDSSLTLRASNFNLSISNGARVYVLPCIAGHVGADTAGMVLAEEPQLEDEMTLLVDVGTNAEIVLGNKNRLIACSSPTGPAFEGAQISSGQRAANGAIERVRIDPETLEPRFKVIGCDFWSNEPGFDEQAGNKQTKVTGICGSGIIEVVAEMYLSGVISEDGVVDGNLSERSTRIQRDNRTWSYVLHQQGDSIISVTQNDVRQIQLAKAALYAGIRLLMDKLGVDKVDRIRLAGAFGSYIDVKHAMVLGLIPDCQLEKVSAAGNAAGTGARIALLNASARTEIETIVDRIEKIETAVEPKFQEYFVGAMAFPHKTDPFPLLFAAVQRPPKKEPSDDLGEEGSRRRRRRR